MKTCSLCTSFIVYPLFFMVTLLFSLQHQLSAQPANEKASVEKAIRNSIGWAKEKDFKLLYSIINDSCYLEVDPEDRVVKGFDNFKKAEKFWSSPDFKSIRYELRELEIHLSRSGEVAWFFCRLDDVNEWKGNDASWMNVRWTGVLEKRKGNWVLMQSHFSYPATEDEE